MRRRKHWDSKRHLRLDNFSQNLKTKLPLEEARVTLVVRTGRGGLSKETKRLLAEMGLEKPWQATFLPNSSVSMKNFLKLYKAVVWGYPSLSLVRQLLVKKGCVKGSFLAESNSASVPISDNLIVEEAFGDLGFLSVEDLVNEIFTSGDQLKIVTERLAPISLSNLNKNDGPAPQWRKGFADDLENCIVKVL